MLVKRMIFVSFLMCTNTAYSDDSAIPNDSHQSAPKPKKRIRIQFSPSEIPENEKIRIINELKYDLNADMIELNKDKYLYHSMDVNANSGNLLSRHPHDLSNRDHKKIGNLICDRSKSFYESGDKYKYNCSNKINGKILPIGRVLQDEEFLQLKSIDSSIDNIKYSFHNDNVKIGNYEFYKVSTSTDSTEIQEKIKSKLPANFSVEQNNWQTSYNDVGFTKQKYRYISQSSSVTSITQDPGCSTGSCGKVIMKVLCKREYKDYFLFGGMEFSSGDRVEIMPEGTVTFNYEVTYGAEARTLNIISMPAGSGTEKACTDSVIDQRIMPLNGSSL